MSTNTHAQTAVITGGSKGIGLGIAHALASAGYNIVIAARDRAALAEAEKQIAQSGAGVMASAVDVRDYAAVEKLMQDAAGRFGGIDVLVNNAGVGRFAAVDEMSLDDWHTVIDTNLNAAFYCTRAALPYLRKSPNAYVINISSLAGKNWFAGGAAYCASKAGLNAFSESLMQDVRQHDIRVSYVMPGSVNTAFNFMGSAQADWKLTAEDVAEVVLDLVRTNTRALASRVEMRPSKPR